jgi:tight adherence protein B
MSHTLFVLLFAGLALLMVAALAGLVGLRVSERRQAVRRRIESVASTHMRGRPAQVQAITRRRVTEPLPLIRQIAMIFGYDPAKSDEGMRWYLVLPATLAVAFIAAQCADALLGQERFLVVPGCWVMLSRSLWSWRREKRLAKQRAQFPDALAMIVRSVRVGIPVAEAMHIVANEAHEPTARSFAELASEISIGVPLETALPRLAERSGLAEYRFFSTAIALQAQTGGGLSETLENLADVIRKRIALRARGQALASEARASGYVLALLPLVVGSALYFINPGYIGVLFNDETGRRLFGVAVVSLSCGLYSMQAISKKVLS